MKGGSRSNRARKSCSRCRSVSVKLSGSWRKWSSSSSTRKKTWSGSVERAPLHHPTTDLEQAGPDLADHLDAVRLVALPRRQEDVGRSAWPRRTWRAPRHRRPAARAPRPSPARGRRPPRRGERSGRRRRRPWSCARWRPTPSRGGSPTSAPGGPTRWGRASRSRARSASKAVLERRAPSEVEPRRAGRAGRRPRRRARAVTSSDRRASREKLPHARTTAWPSRPRCRRAGGWSGSDRPGRR